MIFDQIKHRRRYQGLGSRFLVAFDFLCQTDLVGLPDGQTDLIPGEVWATVMRKPGRTSEAAQFEYHRRFADIQCCFAGREQLGWHPDINALRVAKEYDAEKDVGLLQGPIDQFLPLAPGWFAILFPDEPHAPLIGTGELTKVVCKVLLS